MIGAALCLDFGLGRRLNLGPALRKRMHPVIIRLAEINKTIFSSYTLTIYSDLS